MARQPKAASDQAITGTKMPPSARPSERLESARARQRSNQWISATLTGKKPQKLEPIAITMKAP